MRWVVAASLFSSSLVAAAIEDPDCARAARRAPGALVAAGQFVTGFGTSGYMLVFSALMACVSFIAIGRGHATWRGTSWRTIAERAVRFLATIALSGIAAQAIKHLVGRARPILLPVDGPFSFHPMSVANELASFPSGHTTSAFAAATALGIMWPRWRWELVGCAALIGASRVLVGAHYPSDVVGGAALGSFVALVVARGFAVRGPTSDPQAGRTTATPPRAEPTDANVAVR